MKSLGSLPSKALTIAADCCWVRLAWAGWVNRPMLASNRVVAVSFFNCMVVRIPSPIIVMGYPFGEREDAHANINDPWHGSTRKVTWRTNEKAPGSGPGLS
ncbi:hypothetical protein D3C76_1693890 [compost metagenome]